MLASKIRSRGIKKKQKYNSPSYTQMCAKRKKMKENLVSYAQKIWCYLLEKEDSFWKDNMRIKKYCIKRTSAGTH